MESPSSRQGFLFKNSGDFMPETSLKTQVGNVTGNLAKVRKLLSYGVPVTLEKLAEALGLTISQTRTILQRLEEKQEITVQIRRRTTFITLADQ